MGASKIRLWSATMKKTRRNDRERNKKNLIVAVDEGKRTHHGYVRVPDLEEQPVIPFKVNQEGFDMFYETMMKHKNENDVDSIQFGYESTGSYSLPLAYYMKDRNVDLVQVNPKHVKRLKEGRDNSPNKTDKKDPKVIADIMQLGWTLSTILPEGVPADLRRLVHDRESFIKHRNEVYNQIEGLMAIVFPELTQMADIRTKSVRRLLSEHTLPWDIAKQGKESIVELLHTTSRGQLKKPKIEAIFKAAEQTVGVKEGSEPTAKQIQRLLRYCERFDKDIEEIEREISETLAKVDYAKHMLSIKGLGEVTCATLIGETGGFENFSTAREILKLAGLNLYEISSGERNGQRRISKRGRSLLRKALYFAALNTTRKGGLFREKYENYTSRGKKKPALIMVARKLLVLIFALVREGRDCDNRESKLEEAA